MDGGVEYVAFWCNRLRLVGYGEEMARVWDAD